MKLAEQTFASPVAIWVMVVILSILTAILVSAPIVAGSWQARANRRARRLTALGLSDVAGGAAAAASVSPAAGSGADPASGSGPSPAAVPAQRGGSAAPEPPTRPDLPAVPGGAALPEQRGGESDRAARIWAGDVADDDEDDPGPLRP